LECRCLEGSAGVVVACDAPLTSCAFDIDTTEPDWSLAFRFDLVLRGRQATPFGV